MTDMLKVGDYVECVEDRCSRGGRMNTIWEDMKNSQLTLGARGKVVYADRGYVKVKWDNLNGTTTALWHIRFKKVQKKLYTYKEIMDIIKK